MRFAFIVVLVCIGFVLGKKPAATTTKKPAVTTTKTPEVATTTSDFECVDEDEELEGINCAQLKAEGNCNPDYHPDAISCLKTCNLCDIDEEFSAEEETTHTFEDECMDEEIDGINCAQLKKEGKCDPINHADAIFCQKTCGICGSEV